ncbi:sensor histidine kinase [Microbispora rosea]|uniref:sensor histidine kinase n=1 Tax=Microbispora rosea TaxID=58117 RepID=UPI00068AD4AC|nr:histidine kinase [Microbispora rosea]
MGEKWAGLAARREAAADVLLAVAVLAFGLPAVLFGRSFPDLPFLAVPAWAQIAAVGAAAASMLVRRSAAWPMIAATVACGLLSGQTMPLMLAAYSMTSQNTVRRWPWVAVALAGVYALADWASPYTDRLPVAVVVRAITLILLPALVGTWVWRYRSMIRELRAGVRAREERAAAQERRRIAGELHDTVTHAVTVMVLNAGLIQDADELDEIRKLARNIEDKGVRALTELRELLTALRRRDLPPSAESVEGIPRLVEESRATGLRVALHYDVPEETLSRQAGHACYRVVQEGLNNVRKHAPGADVQVVCEAHGGVLNVSVVNSGKSRAVPVRVPADAGGGYGLPGLRERVAQLGGRLTYGPTAEGGFALTATVPFHPPDQCEA